MSVTEKAVIVGLYGVSGSGKSYCIRELEATADRRHFNFYEGARMISTVTPGGFSSFQSMPRLEQDRWRQAAIEEVKTQCIQTGKLGVVAGHCVLWNEDNTYELVHTSRDLDLYSHILYLRTSPDIVFRQRQQDSDRVRARLSIEQIRQWQDVEIETLRKACAEHGILFHLVDPAALVPVQFSELLNDFRVHNEAYNLQCAENDLDKGFQQGLSGSISVVLDADKTIAPVDTGKLFWQKCNQLAPQLFMADTLHGLFSGPLAYSYTAFRQNTLLYEQAASVVDFEAICQDLSDAVQPYPEMTSFLHRMCSQPEVSIVVVTCGLNHVWDKVVQKMGLSKPVRIIGGSRINDRYVVTPQVKGAIVSRLKEAHNQTVYAFGDSPVDMEMLKAADEAFVIVPNEDIRSKTMEKVLARAIDADELKAQQVLLPSNVTPRLNAARLPITTLANLDANARRPVKEKCLPDGPKVFHMTDSGAAKLLMTSTRDASCFGPPLREAHRHIGRYLATQCLTESIGLEKYSVPHVQGRNIEGFRLRDEATTTIVALMRGGEPMASGVSDCFPLAMFVHAREASDILAAHVQDQSTVLLVDSVINSGHSIEQFTRRIRALSSTVQIAILAGVVQEESIRPGGLVADVLANDSKVELIALRLSKNKFTGSGSTDTGNRLFNTTHLP